MKKKLISFLLPIILQLLFISNVVANIPIDWFFGRECDYTNARSLSLAGIATVLPSPLGMFANPALLGLLKRPSFALSADFSWVSEKRTKELFDSFENSIGEISVADNFFTNTKLGPFAIAYPQEALGGAKICFGLFFAPTIDYNYYFRKEMRDDFYQRIALYEIKVTGLSHNINFASGINLNKFLSVGVGLNYSKVFRTITFRDTSTFEAWQKIDSFSANTLNFNFGLVTGFGEKVKFGFDFQNRWKMHWDYSSLQVLPPIIVYNWTNSAGFGASYHFPGTIPTLALTELRYIYWQEYPPDYCSNKLEIRAGIEHIMFNGVNLRYGFGIIPSLVKRIQPTALISFGIGFDVESIRFDIGGNIQRRTLTPENFYWPITEERVYQTFGDVIVSVSRSF